jgi:hypothetical protein
MKNWQRGRTLITPVTRKWTPEQFAQNDLYERTIVFSDFTNIDAGRSRKQVCSLNTSHPEFEQNAKLIENAPAMLSQLHVCLQLLIDQGGHESVIFDIEKLLSKLR